MAEKIPGVETSWFRAQVGAFVFSQPLGGVTTSGLSTVTLTLFLDTHGCLVNFPQCTPAHTNNSNHHNHNWHLPKLALWQVLCQGLSIYKLIYHP